MFKQISDWISPAEGESIESKQRDFNNRSYLMWADSMMKVLGGSYRIVRVDEASPDTVAHAAHPSTCTRLSVIHNLRVPHRLIMFLEDSDSDERLAVSFYPYDKWDVEVRFHYCHQRTDFSRLWTEIEYHFDRHGLLKNSRFDGDFQCLDLQRPIGIPWSSAMASVPSSSATSSDSSTISIGIPIQSSAPPVVSCSSTARHR